MVIILITIVGDEEFKIIQLYGGIVRVYPPVNLTVRYAKRPIEFDDLPIIVRVMFHSYAELPKVIHLGIRLKMFLLTSSNG